MKDNNTAIQWHVALKAPAGVKCQHIRQGLKQWQYDPKYTIDHWLRDRVSAQVWTSHIVANDDPPLCRADSHCGHSKTLVCWNDECVGWLIHSVPNWPTSFTLTNEGDVTLASIDEPEHEYGQSFVWLLLPKSVLSEIMHQLHIEHVHVYARCDEENVFEKGHLRRKHRTPILRKLNLSTSVFHVAKNAEWGGDLYDECCVPDFGGPCRVETWLRPKEEANKNSCNVVRVYWPSANIQYHEHLDHSKWAISDNPERPWVHIGGINRMKSQRQRGGGGVIIVDKDLWNAFDTLVAETDGGHPVKDVSHAWDASAAARRKLRHMHVEP